MCVPIFPAAAHPLGRRSIHLKENRELPWSECYQSTMMRTRVVVSATEDKGFHEEFTITDDRVGDLMGLWRYQIEDKRRSSVLSETLNLESLRDSNLPVFDGRPASYRRRPSAASMRDSIGGSEEDLRLSPTSAPSAWYEYQGVVRVFQRAPRRLHVDVSYDLSSITRPPDPCEFFRDREIVFE